MAPISIPLKAKYKATKSSGSHSGGSSTGKKKLKVTQGNGNRKKAYGPF